MGYFIEAGGINTKAMLPLLMIVAAPIIQIVLSALRIAGRIVLPLGLTVLLVMGLGFALSFAAMSVVSNEMLVEPGRPRCLIVEGAFFMVGLMITGFVVPVIGFISWIIYYLKTKNKKAEIPVSS